MARAILTVLASREIGVDEQARVRIMNTRDTAVLDEWLRRAVTGSCVADLFAR